VVGDDTDDNATDFTAGAPTPVSCGADCVGPPPERMPFTTIAEIQGTAHRSPLQGTAVIDVLGVVTSVGGNGFWFQVGDPDTDPATSDGLFVVTPLAGRRGVAMAGSSCARLR
jgi:predicted extracellular nuclease